MAIDEISYLTYAEAVFIHIRVMRLSGETRYGVSDRNLIESTLARPQHAAAYESADLIRQAATLCFGMIKNHPWVGGNKRTATALVEDFLLRNSMQIIASPIEVVEMVLAVESNRWEVEEIEIWLRQHTARRI